MHMHSLIFIFTKQVTKFKVLKIEPVSLSIYMSDRFNQPVEPVELVRFLKPWLNQSGNKK